MKKAEYEILAELEKQNRLTASSVVKAASDPDSPLHKHFTWDDTQAAKAHRLQQARTLIRSFTLVVTTPPKSQQVLNVTQSPRGTGGPRAFVAVGKAGSSDKQPFTSRASMLADPALRRQHLENVLTAIGGYLASNPDLSELNPIALAVAEVRASLVRRKAS